MSKLTAITSALVLALNVLPAFALTPVAAPTTKIEAQVPGTTTGAAFINVRRIFALYGDLIRQAPQYSQVEKAIAAGFPDPAKDLDQVGVVSNIDNFANSAAGVVVTGSINMDGLMKFAQSQNVTFSPSLYRGVTLMTGKLDNRSTQVGFVDENTTIVSIDAKGDGVHEGTKSLVATLKKEAPSFGERNALTLPANYLANLSLQVPAEIAASADSLAGGQFAPLKALKFLAASVTADERSKDARLEVVATCDTAENAAAVHGLLQTLSGALAGNASTASLLQKLTITLEGKNVTITLTIPRKDMESWVANGKR